MNKIHISKQQIIIGLVVIGLLLLQFFAVPSLRKERAEKIVLRICTIWTQENSSEAIDFWEDVEKSPPIYNLSEFKILKTHLLGKKDNRKAYVLVDLTFPPSEKRPLNGKWVFIVRKGDLGWKVVDFVRYSADLFPFEQ